ncbi:hypothetical protein WI89_11080 [Burkholderia ubonensis]|nr:hypothetical protein WI89_11080 [Burkholderia ubonensis]
MKHIVFLPPNDIFSALTQDESIAAIIDTIECIIAMASRPENMAPLYFSRLNNIAYSRNAAFGIYGIVGSIVDHHWRPWSHNRSSHAIVIRKAFSDDGILAFNNRITKYGITVGWIVF